MIALTLPWPPSVNTYWRHPTRGKLAGRHLISAEGRSYRQAVGLEVRRAIGKGQPLDGRLDVELRCHPPDRRRRDIDNLPKGILDALQAALVYRDDSQIDRLCIVRDTNGTPGTVHVVVREWRP